MTSLNAAQALGNLPQGLRDELMKEYTKITRAYVRRHWETAELDGGRFSEVVYSILNGFVDGSFPSAASKPTNFPQACERLAHADKETFPQSVRLGMPRVLIALYEIRNNRGVGHVGGDVDANHMDATYVLHAVQWVMAELVRLFHDTDVSTATRVVSALTDRILPIIWKVGDRRRILDTSVSLADSVLLLLYGEVDGCDAKALAHDLKQDRFANFKRVLDRLDGQVLIEYDEASGRVEISPSGEKDVEERLLPRIVQA